MGIHKKLVAIRKEIGSISKSSDNPFYNSKYSDIATMLEAIDPVLEKHGVSLAQPNRVMHAEGVVWNEQGTILTDSETEEFVESWAKMPDLTDPQKIVACSTYFRRMTLQGALATKAVDDDGNTASGKGKSKPKSSGGSKRRQSASEDF